MYSVSCKLLSPSITQDDIGVQTETITEREVPITKIEDVYAKEFYQANEQGFQPTLRIIISVLNYNKEKELIYNGVTYSIIRTQNVYMDELTLV